VKKNKKLKAIFSALGIFLLLAGLSFGLFSPERPRDVASEAVRETNKTTVIAFYPTVGTIKDLMTLRQNKLIDIPNLQVVGAYHEKEKTDYGKSKAFVAENGLDWITFHPISAPIRAEEVFQANACTPEFEKLFGLADGVIFFGGPDIPPYLYKEKTNFLTIIEDPFRHFLEVSFVFHLLGGYQDEAFKPLLESRPDFPILGLCLGCQSLNVGTGGTLIQDIWSEVNGVATFEDAIALGPSNWHSNPYVRLLPQDRFSGFFFHEIEFAQEGRFQKEIGWKREDRPLILSSHHQAAERLGKGFRIIASSLDGKVVEAFEHERYRHVLGLQFHPEAFFLYDPDYRTRFTPEDKDPVSTKSYLEKHPAGRRFHQKLWAWVSRAWLEQHKKR
jgi:putative glutamine amidotransferase